MTRTRNKAARTLALTLVLVSLLCSLAPAGYSSGEQGMRGSNVEARVLKSKDKTKSYLQSVEREQGMLKRAKNAYGQLPLGFEANVGQTDGRVQFLSRGAGYNLFLTAGEAVLDLSGAGEHASHKAALVARELGEQAEKRTRREVVRWKFAGANREARASGLMPLENKSNYFIGKDAKNWRTGIVNYQRVLYRGIYKGVDLVYYGQEGRLEYDLLVAPGADASAIKLDFAGVGKLELDGQGSLLLHTAGGAMSQPRPFIYQEVDGVRRIVEGRYVLKGQRRVGFEVEAYDRSRPLVIDPVLVYSSYLAGSGADEATSIAVDAAGNAYVTGITDSPNFPTTTGAMQTGQSGSKDVFVAKLNAAGSALVYATYLGGALDDEAYGLALGPSGTTYVTGTTASHNFPVTTGSVQTFNGGNSDAFVAKLDATGAGLAYSTYLGGGSSEEGFGIAVNSTGDAYVTGMTASSNYLTTSGALQTSLGGPLDAFITKLNPSGTSASYSTYLGGSAAEIGFGITLDGLGENAYVTGLSDSANFATTTGAFQTTPGGGSDAFAVKLNKTGTGTAYATLVGGSGSDLGLSIAVDIAGNSYLTGLTDSTNFPTTTGALQTTNGGGGSDAFTVKLNAAGSSAVYSTYLGGNGMDLGFGIAVDAANKAYLTGTTESFNFPLTPGSLQAAKSGGRDAFLLKLNPSGSALDYGTYFGGSSDEESFGIALDQNGNAYVAGTTASTNFPTTTGAFQTSAGGGNDAFVLKVGLLAAPCSYAISPAGQTFSAGGGSGSTSITAPDGCSWTANSNDNWISILNDGSGIGNGTVNYSVAANPAPSARSGTLTIAGQTFNVMQSGVSVPSGSIVQFTSSSYTVNESDRSAIITLTRTGDISGTVTIDFRTSDGTAHQRTDYTHSSGALTFSPGKTSNTFVVLITDNAFVDGSRTVNLSLSSPTSGLALGTPSTAILTITDNDTAPATTNPIDDARFFVRQNYADFLSRDPDQGGLEYWTDRITQCGTNVSCINFWRSAVSAAFFIELEFQNTGSFVYRFSKASYGVRPAYAQFTLDRARVVDSPNLEQNKQNFADLWVQRTEFVARYGQTSSCPDFTSALITTVRDGSGVDLTPRRDELIAECNIYAGDTKAQRSHVLRKLVEYPEFVQAEYNRAFVLMQYFGYLKRDPDEGGYQFWLDVVNHSVPNDPSGYRSMVCAFITSPEYQQRFSPVITRNDTVCAPQ
jgi:hypothetical protein